MDVINVINRWQRTDRMESFCNQMRTQKAPFRIWNGVEGNLTPAQNINAAHKQIIRWAKENKLERVMICEDDCIWTADNAYEYFLSQIPDSYDIFFSMLYSAEIKGNKILNGFSGLTGYMVHEKAFDFILSIPDHQHLDRAIGEHCHLKEFYVCNPYVAKQIHGYSDNQMKKCEYSEFEKKMTFYTG